MLDTLGITELLIARGLVTTNWQIRLHETGERAVFELSHIAADTRYPFRLQCEQSVLCQLAEEKAANDKSIEIIREVEVVKSSARVVDGQIAEYRVELKIHFEYEGG